MSEKRALDSKLKDKLDKKRKETRVRAKKVILYEAPLSNRYKLIETLERGKSRGKTYPLSVP